MDSNAHHAPALEQLVTASNDIGFKILSELLKKEGERNVLISPLSVSFALCMLYNGAGSATRQALRDVLAARAFTVEEINEASLALRSHLVGADSRAVVRIANALWAHESLRFDEDFTRTVKRFYAADARSLNFNDPSTPAVINEWAMEQTDGKIYPLLNSDDISAATECVMSAAIYFKGAWAAPFPPDATRKEPFYLQGRQSQEVWMMRGEGRYQFHQTPQFQVVGLPYGNDRLSMYVFLPSENSSPAELLQMMNAQVWEECLKNMKEKKLTLFLPRFKLTYEVELNDPLKKMGLGAVFATGADFGPMGLGNHYVEKFKHKTLVEVNEEGAEAAAVSAVMMGRSLAPSRTMLVNRPFFWAIRDNITRALIFTSLVLKPG